MGTMVESVKKSVTEVTDKKLIYQRHKRKFKEIMRNPVKKQVYQHSKVNLKPLMLEALKVNYGIVSFAADQVGINRKTHYDWLKNDPEYKKEHDYIAEIAVDIVEHELFKQIKSGNHVATIFFLKTKGKNRGYRETIENINKNYNTDWTASVIEAHEKREKIVEGVVESKEEVIVDVPVENTIVEKEVINMEVQEEDSEEEIDLMK